MYKKRFYNANMEVNCIIVHGCPDNVEQTMDSASRVYDKHWMPWLKRELISRGIKTEIPHMPNPWEPDYGAFKREFEKYPVSEHTILIGHSCGGAFLVRWLGESKQRIKKLILVAPWKISDLNDPIREAFYTYPIDQGITERVGKITIFTADNEVLEGKESVQLFHHALGGELIELQGKGHYTLEDMGTEVFPELLDKVLS